MIYFLDCEFNGFGGELLSLALVRGDGASLYVIYPQPEVIVPWVAENVIPVMNSFPTRGAPGPVQIAFPESQAAGAHCIAAFLAGDPRPEIVADWPDDVAYFTKALMTGPGEMVGINRLAFEMVRVQSYPTALKGAVQHNAWWDAMALRHVLISNRKDYKPPRPA